MGTETRIGIVAGLLIVVVASVYFFYGNDARDEDFLVSTGPRVSEPPQIPSEIDGGVAPGSIEDSTARQATPNAEFPARQTGSANQELASNRGSGALGSGGTRRGAPRGRFPTHQPSTPLRTGPAPQLVEATRGNLEVGETGEGSFGTDLADIGQRIRQSVRQLRDSDGRTERPARRQQPRHHTIAAGETLSEIAVQYFGTSRRIALILQANPQIENPDVLKVGDVLVIPAVGTAQPGQREPAAADDGRGRVRSSGSPPPAETRRTYRVRKGDTFYSIASSFYGSGARWQEVYRLNKHLVKNDPKRLRPGMVITLP